MLIGRIFERYCVSVSVILRFAKKLVTYAGLVYVTRLKIEMTLKKNILNQLQCEVRILAKNCVSLLLA